MIKNLFLGAILLISSLQLSAQTYGNEWIDYSQSYAKFSLFEEGIFRITNNELTSAGIIANGGTIQVFRDGQQIPIYVSNTGNFGTNDFIEFYGEPANGKVDEGLFINPSLQMNPSQNLISDTAFYFVTLSNNAPHLRVTLANNTISGSLVKEPYLWGVKNINFRGALGQGPCYIGEFDPSVHYIRSSQFEQAEGYVNAFSYNAQTLSANLDGLYKGAGAPNATVQTMLTGFSWLNTHKVRIDINNTFMADSTFPRFTAKKYNLSVPNNLIGANNLMSLKFTPQNSQPTANKFDRVGVSNINARYPLDNDFAGNGSRYFELNPKSGSYYLEIQNYSGISAPWLYDLDANVFYEANTTVANLARFKIPANGSVKRLQFVSRQGGALKSVNNLSAITFKNYSNATNQGDYIIVTHPYYFDGNGQNYVEQYKNFRSSSVGGNYNAIVASVEDIYNEFGYGYTFHAQAIRNFLNYSHTSPTWNDKSKFAFLIGKGIVYSSYLSYSQQRQTTPGNVPYVPIPTFGVPASDIMLTDFNRDYKPELPIGRLSILNGGELENYLDKAKVHEARIQDINNQFVDSVLWRKSLLHVSGGKSASENGLILNPLNRQKNMLVASEYGGIVNTFAKSSTASIQLEDTEEIEKLVNKGVGFLQFFGHGSSSTVDFGGFDNPSLYLPHNRYTIFMANGCGVGNVFSIGATKTLSESWMEAPERGSVGFIANSNVGYLGFLGNYTDSLYRQMGIYRYGSTIGEQLQGNVANIFSNQLNISNNITRLHTEQILLQGDPAIGVFGPDKPDYAVEDKYLKISPVSLTSKLDSFNVELVAYNLGRQIVDSFNLLVTRTLPNGSVETILSKDYASLSSTDTLRFNVATGGTDAIGFHKLNVKIDNGEEIVEVAEYNNEINRTIQIYNDDLEPIYPYDFSIVNYSDLTLKASTLNPFLDSRQYVLQIDTTENFNSSLLKTTRINSKGGLVKWKPNVSMMDSVVYYWRTALDTIYDNPVQRWTTSSFIYLPNSSTGWNQSHYFQYAKDNYQNIVLDSTQRDFNFTTIDKKLQVQNVCLRGPNPYFYVFADYSVKINGVTLYTFGSAPYGWYKSLQFMLIDSLTGIPIQNTIDPNNPTRGLYGSWKPSRGTTNDPQADYFFEYSFVNTAWRQAAMNFIDSIPDGVYVMMQPRLCLSNSCGGRTTQLIDDWKSDTATLGSNNSLYHKIKDLGFTAIDSLYKNRSMACFMQKGNPQSIEQHVGIDSTVKLYREFTFKSTLYEGKIVSDEIGKASQWTDFKRSGTDVDNGQIGDTVAVEIFGIDINNTETLLATVTGDTSLSFIDAAIYPKLRLVMNQRDINYSSPEQVKYWRVHYTPVPEAALNPNAYLSFNDSLGQGQQLDFKVAIENLTDIPMDSMLVKYSLVNSDNQTVPLETIRYKPLPGNDTIIVSYPMETTSLSGVNYFVIEANPADDQPEQYHPNNIGLKRFNVKSDNENPILDVTFDGVHILNKDIVSAKPSILISLRDENQFLPLDDTSSMQVSLRYPNNPNVDVPISYSDPNLTFLPADPNSQGENKARIEFRPTFLVDGDYELIVQGKDKMQNVAGNVEYKIAFKVITKSSVTSVLNYPNPFSSSTQFVFTLTGSEVPEQFKIQVYSVTGKVVREISRAEIGNIHIGRNITDFRWKGDDQFGDKLGNGVYLYRVVTRLNGQEMDKAENDGAGQWTEKGFGKLYIMR